MKIEQRVRISLQHAQYEQSYNRDGKEKGKLSNATQARKSPSLPFYLIFKVAWQKQPRSQGFFAGMVFFFLLLA